MKDWAEHLGVRHYVVPVSQHPLSLYKLVRDKDVPSFYVSYSMTHSDDDIRREINGTIKRLAGYGLVIDPQAIEIGGNFDVFQAHDLKQVKALLNGYYKVGDFENYHIAKELFADLRPSHACTVHKSQGSTYKTVYIDLGDIGSCYEANAVARMLNTAISRASERLVLFGELPLKYRS